MGIQEAATYPFCRPEETIRCISGVRVVPPSMVWQLRASKCGYLLCEHHFSSFFMKKIRWWSCAEKKDIHHDAGPPTHWPPSLLVRLIVAVSICFVLAAAPFISSLEYEWFGSGTSEIFDSHVMCWIPKRPRIAPPITQTILCTHMQRLVALGSAENGQKATRRFGPKCGVAQVMCVFFVLRGRVFHDGIT